MSLLITRAGILDTVQDHGRYGYQHLGINPGGAMDRFSASLANALLGKDLTSPVIEFHFPAAQIRFEKSCIVCLAGADFTPLLNDEPLPVHQPVLLKEGAVLQFKGLRSGARCYLSVLNELLLEQWLQSFSTNLKAGAGGYQGRSLKSGDRIALSSLPYPEINKGFFTPLPWKYNNAVGVKKAVRFIPGKEWNWITTKSQTDFLNNTFRISAASDRMGYRLQGEALVQRHQEQLLSSAVGFGTVQLLPNGQLIALMADHQTTGGYPRIGHIISADLPKLAQAQPGAELRFVMTNVAEAEAVWITQQQYLMQLQNSCNLKMQNWWHAGRH
jgi:antagonist of KipI